MRPTEWSGGAIRQNILPPTLNTITPSHCTVRVAAGSEPQKVSICFGVMAITYTARARRAMVGHERVASRQIEPPAALPAGARAHPGSAAPVVRGRRLRRGRDADPAGGAGGGGSSLGFRHRLGNA